MTALKGDSACGEKATDAGNIIRENSAEFGDGLNEG